MSGRCTVGGLGGWEPGQNDTGTDVLEMIDPLQVGDVLEHEGVVDGDLPPDPLVHGVDEGLKVLE